MVNYDEKTNTYKKQHHFNNLGKRSGKNALIFNGETVVSVRYGAVLYFAVLSVSLFSIMVLSKFDVIEFQLQV